ncbi:toxin Y4kP [Hoeflea sp. BAL378]|uniref:type II toxin-antitoxin system RelE/ParE family toxin n=1 Tax=Hoeflea sp. BAL378 TaxID=1547437 RepID=UPI0005147ABF|nr:type II toxin-antitoxin system RelE/ParE family toxin [Hoeflea sp. BAL378]KGF67146.1 toxin Y4kP [Hoeflea sp. BAL378]
MTSRTIRWTRRALGRLDHIGAWIARENPEAAARVISRIVAAADALSQRPAMGRPGRIKSTREFVLADISFIIAYRVTDSHVDILTVMHTAQQWPETL